MQAGTSLPALRRQARATKAQATKAQATKAQAAERLTLTVSRPSAFAQSRA